MLIHICNVVSPAISFQKKPTNLHHTHTIINQNPSKLLILFLCLSARTRAEMFGRARPDEYRSDGQKYTLILK